MLIVLTAKICLQKYHEASWYCRVFSGSYCDSYKFLETSRLRMIILQKQLLLKGFYFCISWNKKKKNTTFSVGLGLIYSIKVYGFSCTYLNLILTNPLGTYKSKSVAYLFKILHLRWEGKHKKQCYWGWFWELSYRFDSECELLELEKKWVGKLGKKSNSRKIITIASFWMG